MTQNRESGEVKVFPRSGSSDGGPRQWHPVLLIVIGTLVGSAGSIGYNIFEGGRGVERVQGELRYLTQTVGQLVTQMKEDREDKQKQIDAIKARQDSDWRLYQYQQQELKTEIAVLRDRLERGR